MKNIPVKVILVLFFILMLLPLYWMFLGSLQNITKIMSMPPNIFPSNPSLYNYKLLLRPESGKWIINTLLVVTGSVTFSVISSLTSGYAFAYFNFPCKGLLWSAMLVRMMIPRISILIPLYVTMKKLGLSGTLLAVILPDAFSPFGMFLARNYFQSIPKELLESARLDGANEFEILRYVVAPVSKPIVSALALFAGIGALQDYIWQMLVLQDPTKQTLLVGVMRAAMERGGGELSLNPIGRGFAAGIVLFIPLLIIFLVANKYFTESLGGAIKE